MNTCSYLGHRQLISPTSDQPRVERIPAPFRREIAQDRGEVLRDVYGRPVLELSPLGDGLHAETRLAPEATRLLTRGSLRDEDLAFICWLDRAPTPEAREDVESVARHPLLADVLADRSLAGRVEGLMRLVEALAGRLRYRASGEAPRRILDCLDPPYACNCRHVPGLLACCLDAWGVPFRVCCGFGYNIQLYMGGQRLSYFLDPVPGFGGVAHAWIEARLDEGLVRFDPTIYMNKLQAMGLVGKDAARSGQARDLREVALQRGLPRPVLYEWLLPPRRRFLNRWQHRRVHVVLPDRASALRAARPTLEALFSRFPGESVRLFGRERHVGWLEDEGLWGEEDRACADGDGVVAALRELPPADVLLGLSRDTALRAYAGEGREALRVGWDTPEFNVRLPSAAGGSAATRAGLAASLFGVPR